MTKFLLAALFLALAGCDKLDNCPDARDPITASDKNSSTDLEAMVYQSTGWEGGFEPFPPNTELHFVHGLGVEPYLVKAYVSFSTDGTNGAGGGDTTENAGNQGRIQCVDAREIVIENDTCEEHFFIRVVALASPSGKTDGPPCTPE